MYRIVHTLFLALVCSLAGSSSVMAHHVSEQNQVHEMTLSIIKPDAVSDHHIGDIIQRFEQKNLRVAAIKMAKLNRNQAEEFYSAHKDRPFLGSC